MKLKFFIALVAALVLSLSVNAQIHSSTNSKITRIREKKLVLDTTNYNRFSVGYSQLSWYDLLRGAELGYLHGFHLSHKNSCFLELGLRASFNKKTRYEDHGADLVLNRYLFSMSLPVSFTYKLKFANGLYLSPYVGPYLRVNIIGIDKMDFDNNNETLKKTMKYNLFDSEETSPKRNRAQFGGQMGLIFGYKAINVGVGVSIGDGVGNVKDNESFGVSTTIGVNF